MKAIILAAGLARRMRPLSTHRHKTLIEIDGRSVISRIIDSLVTNGITDLCVVTGYRSAELRDAVSHEFPELQVRYIHNPDFETTNNVYSMALALEQLDCGDGIILIESDLVFEPAVLRRLIAADQPNVALVDHYRTGMDGTVVAVSPSGVITQVLPPSMQGEHFDFSDMYKTLNIYKFDGGFCRSTFRELLSWYARTVDRTCYYELILGILIYMQQVEVHAEILDGERWAEIDDPNDVSAAEFLFAPSRRREQLQSAWGGHWNTPVIDFASIRNVHFPTPAILSELRASLPELVVNYGSAQETLNRKLGYFLLCDPANVQVLNGASQAFPLLGRLFGQGDVLIPTPTFAEYERVFPSARTYPDRTDGGELGVDLAQVEDQMVESGLVVIVNPNNPTGAAISTPAIVELARRHPRSTVLLDESFIEFSSQESILPSLERTRLQNVIVLTSLSKCLGMPGVRLGFLYSCCPGLLEAVAAEIPIWNLSSIAEHVLEVLLKNRNELARSYALTVEDRRELEWGLRALPCVSRVFPSEANFLLVQTSLTLDESTDLVDQLLSEDAIYVRDVSSKFEGPLAHWRVAVRSRTENAALCEAISRLVPRRIAEPARPVALTAEPAG